MIDSLVTTSEKDAVLFVMLNRPERRNPLSSDMIAALSDAIASGNANPDTRVIPLCSGRALKSKPTHPEIKRRLQTKNYRVQ